MVCFLSMRRLVIFVSCILLLVVLVPLIMSPRIAFAHPLSFTVAINPTQGPPSTKVTGTGSNWPAGDQMEVLWEDQTTILGKTTVTSNGTFTISFIIPANATQAAHTLYFWDVQQRTFLTQTFNVYVLSVQRVWTMDGNNNSKTSFTAGDAIRYGVSVNNVGSTTLTATFTFLATGSRQIFYWSGPGPVASGTPGFYSPSTVPTDTASGTYTLTVTVALNGLSSSKQSQFKVSYLRLPWVSGAYSISGNSYGCGDHIDNPGTKYRDTYAIDFGLTSGTPIAAIADGIAHTGSDGKTNYGNYIWIAHTNPNGSFTGYISLYAHLSSFHITEGQPVKRGDWIGNAGSTGNSSGPHLHFSLRNGYDGKNLSSAAPALPEPMSGYTGFGHYGYTKDNGCTTFIPSSAYTV